MVTYDFYCRNHMGGLEVFSIFIANVGLYTSTYAHDFLQTYWMIEFLPRISCAAIND